MKKLLYILLPVLVFTMYGCAGEDLTIEGHTWTFTYGPGTAGMADGTWGDICAPELTETYPDAIPMQVQLVATGTPLTYEIITGDPDMDINRYTVQFTLYEADPESCIYVFEMYRDTGELMDIGNAVTGITTYADGSSEYTLILPFSEGALYFTSPREDK